MTKVNFFAELILGDTQVQVGDRVNVDGDACHVLEVREVPDVPGRCMARLEGDRAFDYASLGVCHD